MYGKIPENIREKLASERVRAYHAIWHFVRSKSDWESLTQAQRYDLTNQGWEPPRFEGEPNAGIDFLFMHRQMIEMVEAWNKAENSNGSDHGHRGHHNKVKDVVIPWMNIPFAHHDPVWPMPVVNITGDPVLQEIFARAKNPAVTEFYRDRVSNQFSNRQWLRTQTLDQFGTELERTIHGWMHMHWSTEPPVDSNSLDTENDWLGSPFSSHVNDHFWKLHGWIDDRIIAWGDANGEEPDLSVGWDGPFDSVTGEMHSASPELIKALHFENRPRLMMIWNDRLLEDEF